MLSPGPGGRVIPRIAGRRRAGLPEYGTATRDDGHMDSEALRAAGKHHLAPVAEVYPGGPEAASVDAALARFFRFLAG